MDKDSVRMPLPTMYIVHLPLFAGATQLKSAQLCAECQSQQKPHINENFTFMELRFRVLKSYLRFRKPQNTIKYVFTYRKILKELLKRQ